MISVEVLKEIIMLAYLNDDMLEKLTPLIDILNYEERETVFKEGDVADRFYMLRRGKILLEKRATDKISVSLGAIKQGYSFGWSAIFEEGGTYTSDAVCAEHCEVFSIRGVKIKKILDSNPSMGYIFTQRILRLMKSRLDHRTDQFVKVIKSQPEMQALFKS